MKKRAIIALMLALVFVFASCGTNATSESVMNTSGTTTADASADAAVPLSTGDDKTLTVGLLYEPVSLYPAESANAYTYFAPVYEYLVYYNYETGEFEPQLAESWEFEDDQTVVFHLREDKVFSDGTPFTAADVLFCLECYMDESTKSYSSLAFIDLANCTSDGDYTVTFKFTEPSASALMKLAAIMPIFSKAYFEANGIDAMGTSCMGTGPYRLSEWKSGYSITYSKNEKYVGEKEVYYDTIVMRVYSESTTMMIDYETGALDMAVGITDNDVSHVKEGSVEATNLYMIPTFNTAIFAVWPGCEKTQDARVREAIACALDIETITEAVYGNLGTTATSLLASSIQFHIDCDTYKYDPEHAKKLLEEAGATGLVLDMISENDSNSIALAEWVQAQLAEVGITVNVSSFDTGTCIPKWLGLENGMIPECDCLVMCAAFDTPDPDSRLTAYKQNSGFTLLMQNDDINDMMMEANTILDDAARKTAYAEMQQAIADQAYLISISELTEAIVVRDNITGLSDLDPYVKGFYLTRKAS